MKKTFPAFLSLFLICTVLLCACNDSVPGTSNPSPAFLTLATGGSGGTYDNCGKAICKVLNENLANIELTTKTSGASKANIFLVEDGDADLAIVSSDVLHYACNGTELFAGEGTMTGVSAVAALYTEVCQIITTREITSIDQLKGLRIAVGNSNSSVELQARQILKTYGISFDDIIVQNFTLDDSIEALKGDKIDAFFCTTEASSKTIAKLASTTNIHILSIDDSHAKELVESYPFYTQYTIPADSYCGITHDVTTIAVKATLVASNKLSEDIVKSIVKSLFDYREVLADSHKICNELDSTYAVAGVSAPFHPGAIAYFTEAGTLS